MALKKAGGGEKVLPPPGANTLTPALSRRERVPEGRVRGLPCPVAAVRVSS